MGGNADQSIKLYHYNASPYARKVVWYLTLRGLPYAEVRQPMIMPRPDLQAIGVSYRRIPVLTIGKDVYCDTRIILKKLEELFPEGQLSATTPDGQALQKLFEIWHVEGPLFSKGAQSLPLSVFKDEQFSKDRSQMTGQPWSLEAMAKLRPEALNYIRNAFDFLERLLADDRDWILATTNVTLADIEAIFVVHWLQATKGALPEDLVSPIIFPKTHSWIARFDEALRSARSNSPKPIRLNGSTAAKEIFASGFAEIEGHVEVMVPSTPFKKGDRVELFPTDTGFNNKDHGLLLNVTNEEIVIALDNGLRLHTPRAGFRIRNTGSKM